MKKNSDIFVLLVGLIVVSCSLGIIHRRITAQEDRESTTKDAAMASISALISAHDTDGIGQVLVRYPTPVITEILPILMASDSSLVTDEKVLFFAALLYYYIQYHHAIDHQLLEWYEHYAPLFDTYPLFYYAARQPYCALLTPLSRYMIGQGKTVVVRKLFTDAFSYCLAQQDPCSLEILCREFDLFFNVISSSIMTRLLTDVVFENKDAKLAAVVVTHGADVNYSNTTVKPPETLLMRAVSNGNKDIVELLLKNGAAVDTITDVSLGTALQIAFVKKYIVIEALLRSYGALY